MKSPFSTKVRYLVFNEDSAYPICHLLVRQYYTIVAERKEAVMDAIVSARVPIALKERGNGILHDIGSTPTQLINAAYQFVLAEHELPKPHDPLEGMRGTKRELTDEQKEKVRRSLKAMYVGPSATDEPFSRQLNAARDERYARFA